MTSPEDKVDDLLSAPDITAMNEAERKKYKARKSKDRARKAQLLRSKSTETPSIEDMLTDMVRVAEDKNVNPWWETRVLGRKRYEQHGDFLLNEVLDQFGTWAHACEVASLRDKAGTRLKRAARAIASKKEHAARYVKRYVLPYVAKPDDYRELDGSYLLASISDTHSGFLSPFVWHAFLSAIRDCRPDGVLFNGDTLEGGDISRHPKIPAWTMDIQTEFDFQYEMARQVRELHNGDFFVGGGNHGIDRWAMYFTQVAKEIACVRSLKIDKLMGLDEFDIMLLQGGTMMSPDGTENDEHGFLLYDYRIHHGTYLGKTPAATELLNAGRSGQSGHTHRAQLMFGCTEKDKGLSWMSTPMGCTELAARAYIKAGNKGWQTGFGFCRIFPNGQVRQYPVICDGDVCTVEGFVYERPDGLPNPDPMTLWLPDMPLP